MNYFVFLVVYLLTADWHTIDFFKYVIGKKRGMSQVVKDQWIENLVKSKTGVQLTKITLAEIRAFGFMASSPPLKPSMTLSFEAYKNLSNGEKEWLILHEMGHYVLKHSLKELITQVVLISSGLLIIHLSLIDSFSALVLGILLGFLTLQLAKFHEHEASIFALNHMDDPIGMVKGVEALMRKWPKRSIMRRILYRWDFSMYERQKELAEREIIRREK